MDLHSTLASSNDDESSRIPVVTLPTNVITNIIAARMTMSLLSHVLFLKAQIPFPVPRLSRLPPSKNARTNKKREELMVALNKLSSSLESTFAALSVAFAQSTTSASGRRNESSYQSHVHENVAQTHLAILIGSTSSPSGARARIILQIDGLAVDKNLEGSHQEGSEYVPSEEAENDASDDFKPPLNQKYHPRDVHRGEPLNGAQPINTSDSSSRLAHLDPSAATLSTYLTDENRTSSDNDSSEMDNIASHFSSLNLAQSRISATHLHLSRPVSSTRGHAVAEISPDVAERQLAHALATAASSDYQDSDSKGPRGISSEEFAPSRIYILLHAPRHFHHPGWTPRQGLQNSMGGVLQTFSQLMHPQTSDSSTNHNVDSKRKRSKLTRRVKGKKVEGVKISAKDACRDGLVRYQPPDFGSGIRHDPMFTVDGHGDVGDVHGTIEHGSSENESRTVHEHDENKYLEDQDDEEWIWFVWDGKITGVADL